MTIGDRLKLVRKKSKLNLEQTAAIFDITAQTLSRYENGKRTPDNDFLESFGKHFNLSGDWLLYGEPPIFKAEDLNKDIQGVFYELSSLIRTGSVKGVEIPEVLKDSIDKMILDCPENYITLLHYMLKDPVVRKNIFQFFYLFQKPDSDKRKEQENP
jgi:transcriptional regulator with XRE-family HTH domain